MCQPSLGRYLSWYIGRYVYRHIGRASVDNSTDVSVACRSICRRIYRSRGAQNTHAPESHSDSYLWVEWIKMLSQANFVVWAFWHVMRDTCEATNSHILLFLLYAWYVTLIVHIPWSRWTVTFYLSKCIAWEVTNFMKQYPGQWAWEKEMSFSTNATSGSLKLRNEITFSIVIFRTGRWIYDLSTYVAHVSLNSLFIIPSVE